MNRKTRRSVRDSSTQETLEPLLKVRKTICKTFCQPFPAVGLENDISGKKRKSSLGKYLSPSSNGTPRQRRRSKTSQSPKPKPPSRRSSRNSCGSSLSPKKNAKKEKDFSSPTVPGDVHSSPTALGDEHTKEITQKVNYLFSTDLRCPPISPFGIPDVNSSSPRIYSTNNQQNLIEELNSRDQLVLMYLVCENCWYLLVPALRNHITENVYLTPLLLRSIFYGITVECKDRICLSLVRVFKTHLSLHSPSRKDLKKLYHMILFGNVKIEEYRDPNIIKYSLRNIINAIEKTVKDVLNEDPLPQENARVENDEGVDFRTFSLDEMLEYINTRYIETGNILSLPAFNFKQNKSTNKDGIDNKALLRRLFLIFSLALDILEENFQMWWMKSSYKLRHKVNSQRSCPYIVEAGWAKDEKKGSINERCVQIFMLFTICPLEYKHHLARYIALCFRVAQANEENTEMKFPYFHDLCNSFATELAHQIKGKKELDENTVNTIQYIYPMWLKFKVCGILLNSDITSNGKDNLHSAYKILIRNLANKKPNEVPVFSSKLSLEASKANTINSEGETPLHKYCRQNSKNCVSSMRKILKYPGTNVNIKDHYGWTPLHNAAMYNSLDCIQLLIKHRLPPKSGAVELDIFALNNNNDSPLLCAVKKRHLQIIDILLENGVGSTVWNKNKDGHSAMDLAPADIRKKLSESWKSSIDSFHHLRMNKIDVDILNLMVVSYCTEYHINEKVDPSDSKSSKSDAVYKYNYSQYFKDCKTFERLLLIVNKLCPVPTNPKDLDMLKNFLNSYR